jgi:hypothetical protein
MFSGIGIKHHFKGLHEEQLMVDCCYEDATASCLYCVEGSKAE